MTTYLMNKNGDIFNASEVTMVQRHKLLDAVHSKPEVQVNELRDYATPSEVRIFKSLKLENGDYARDINGTAMRGELVGVQSMTDLDPSIYFGKSIYTHRSKGGIRNKENQLRKRQA